MDNEQTQHSELLTAINTLNDTLQTLIESLQHRPTELHPRTPMSAEDIYIYCNKRLAINKIAKAMRFGEIPKCVALGNKLVTQRQHVDTWLDKIFNMEKPGTVAGYEIIPMEHLQRLLRKVR